MATRKLGTATARKAPGPYRVVAPDGAADPSWRDLGLDADGFRGLYRLLATVRRADREATALQRQGELAVYPPLVGQEAAQVGSAYALQRDDFVFPSYRELGVAVVRGIDLPSYLHFYRGTWHGGAFDPLAERFATVSVPVGSQAIHATGWAMGARLKKEAACAIAYFGDGATSEGDVHEAFNFAAVFGAPVVFFCQNNGWAISVPTDRQTVAPIWTKAAAYGFEGVQVDGNDVLAVLEVTRAAAERARAGGGPTLIEAVTYRIGPHSTADDATRYQPREDVERWKLFDPLVRYRAFLEHEDLADPAFFADADAGADAFAARMREGVISSGPRPASELFDHVYAEMPDHLVRQRDAALQW